MGGALQSRLALVSNFKRLWQKRTASPQHELTFHYETTQTLCYYVLYFWIIFIYFILFCTCTLNFCTFGLNSPSAFVKREISLTWLVKVWPSELQTEKPSDKEQR